MAQSTRLEILFEDNHLIIVNKRASEIVQGDKTGDVPLSEKVKEYIRRKYEKPGNIFIGVIHRLDRPVSGAVAFAKTSKCLERMNDMFRQHDVQKVYWAVVKNKPEPVNGKLVHYLKKNEQENARPQHHTQQNSKGKAIRGKQPKYKERIRPDMQTHTLLRPHRTGYLLGSVPRQRCGGSNELEPKTSNRRDISVGTCVP